MKTTKQKTAVVTFKTTTENKEALVSAAKAAGMDTSPYIEKQLELLAKLCNSDEVKSLFNKRESQTAKFLSRNGERVYVKLDSISDVLKYYIALDDSYACIMAQLIREGKYLYAFASEEEKDKIKKEAEEEKKIALITENQNQNPPKSI